MTKKTTQAPSELGTALAYRDSEISHLEEEKALALEALDVLGLKSERLKNKTYSARNAEARIDNRLCQVRKDRDTLLKAIKLLQPSLEAE